MGLIRNGNGYYQIRMKINGKLFKRSCKTKNWQTAQMMYDAFLRTEYIKVITLDSAGSQEKAETSIPEAIGEYRNTYQNQKLSAGTLNIKDKILSTLESLNFKNFDQLNQNHLNKLIGFLKSKYTDSYVDKHLVQLKAFLTYCIRQEYYSQSQYNKLVFPRFKTKSRNVIFSTAELNTLFQKVKSGGDADFLMYLKTLFYTASRPNEPVSLKISDMDFEKNTITVFQNKTRKIKEVSVPADFMSELHSYIRQNQLTDFLFEGHNAGKEYYSNKFKNIKEILGLDKRLVLYSLRHTYATHVTNTTGDIQFAAHQLGDTVDTAARYYVNRNIEDYRQVVNQFVHTID